MEYFIVKSFGLNPFLNNKKKILNQGKLYGDLVNACWAQKGKILSFFGKDSLNDLITCS
jgi:hypothetical protein